MNSEIQKRLAESLTAESTDIIPYLPYLLQDFWSLSSEPEKMAELLRSHTNFDQNCRILDLACGKGAAAIYLAKEFNCAAKGIDLIGAFISEAKEKAQEYGVSQQCEFITGDVNEAVLTQRGFDLTIWCGAGDLLGSYPKTVAGIARTVKPGGYILLDEAYIPEEHQCLRFHHDYLTLAQWETTFKENGLTIAAFHREMQAVNLAEYAGELGNIRRRAEELAEQFPDKRRMLEDYVKSQQAEYEDLQDGPVAALWLLRKQN